MSDCPTQVAIVDFGMGNLFSVAQACQKVGLSADITSSGKQILASNAIILPGVGAFGDAIGTLQKLDLVGPLIDFAASGRPLVGICLGMQLLMEESHEFGRHKGLGLISGEVVPLEPSSTGNRTFKIPQIGWNRIYSGQGTSFGAGFEDSVSNWMTPHLEGVPQGEYMYFVHSYITQPADIGVVVANTTYGETEFCSGLHSNNIFACQFHPERSGEHGLRIYNNLAAWISNPETSIET